MPGPSKHRSGCSQSANGWITGLPMEELEKVPKELKGSATLKVEQHYELTSTPRAHVSSCIRSRKWPSRLDADYGVDPWIWQSLHGPSFHLSSKLCLCNSFHGCFVPTSKEGHSVHTSVFIFLEFHVFRKLYLISWVS